MLIKRSVCIFAISLQFLYGCNTDGKTTTSGTKSNVTSGSRKVAVVSNDFLSAEKEKEGQQSHGARVEFAKNGVGIAYVEPFGGKFRVVHNGIPGKPYLAISGLRINSDGSRIAYVGAVSNSLNRLIIDGREVSDYGANDNHYFTPDGKHFISTISQGEDRHLVIDNKVIQDQLTDIPLLAPDSRTVAYLSNAPNGTRKQLVIRDIMKQSIVAYDSCGDFIFPSDDKSMLAVGCMKDGNKSIKLIDVLKRSTIEEIPYDADISFMGFAPDNHSLLYTQVKPGLQRYLVWKGRQEKIPDGDEFFSSPKALSNPESAGVIIGTVYKAYLYRAFQEQNKKGKGYGYISDLVTSKDGRHYAYVATKFNEDQMQIVVDGNEGPAFDKIVSPLFSPDGRFIVYRARDAGKRFIIVSDMKAKVVRRHRDYEMVFQPEFSSDGTSLAYGVLDGNEFWWKVENL